MTDFFCFLYFFFYCPQICFYRISIPVRLFITYLCRAYYTYSSLKRQFPERAEMLYEKAEADAKARRSNYTRLANK